MNGSSRSWIALDIGGANLKAAHSNGEAHTRSFQLWKHPDDLASMLARLASLFPRADRVAVTMTAELCDCYETKAIGVRAILKALTEVFAETSIRVWGTDGQFHSVAKMNELPRLAAASNWLALASVAARLVPNGSGLLIDIGSTTTDIIPLRDGLAVAEGRTDTERLQTGELIYAGVRRTPLSAIAMQLPHRGRSTGLAAELFATTLDVYLTLGDLPPDPQDLTTADGRPATVNDARDRLARTVGADRDDFTVNDAQSLATEADQALLGRLQRSAERLCDAPESVVISGVGSFLARRLASRVIKPGGAIISLDAEWGSLASSVACAHALLILASETE